MKTQHKRYDYRGRIERGCGKDRPDFKWTEGYSETLPDGTVSFPWLTKSEARKEASADGKRAVFYRSGKPE